MNKTICRMQKCKHIKYSVLYLWHASDGNNQNECDPKATVNYPVKCLLYKFTHMKYYKDFNTDVQYLYTTSKPHEGILFTSKFTERLSDICLCTKPHTLTEDAQFLFGGYKIWVERCTEHEKHNSGSKKCSVTSVCFNLASLDHTRMQTKSHGNS